MIKKAKCKVGDLDIAYLDNGNLSADRTILFLHGNSLSKNIFIPLIEQMNLSSSRAIALDFPGHGESDFQESYSMSGLTKVVIEVVKKLELKKPFLVGHSLGGHIAIHVANEIEVSGALLFSTPLIDSLDDFAVAYKNPRALELFGKSDLNNDEAKELCKLVGVPGEWEALLAVDKKFRTSLVESIMQGGNPCEATKWHQLRLTKKIIIGVDDPLVNLDFVREVGKEGEVIGVSEKFSHTPFVENPAAVIKYFDKFIY